MSNVIGTTTVQEVINVPIMISPDLYNQLANLVIQRMVNDPAFKDMMDIHIETWMDKHFRPEDYDHSYLKDDIMDAIRYDLKHSIRAEVEIYVD